MFIFQFEKIKNLKENLMNIEILRLNQINNQIKQNTQKLSDLNDQIKVLQKRFDNQIQIKLDFNILTYIAECIMALEFEIKNIQKIIENLKVEKNKQIEIIKNFHKEIKKFEKLKEHYKERYMYEEKLKEQNFINDINTIFYNRNT